MARPKKQFCVKGHNTFITGRTQSSNCVICYNEWVKGHPGYHSKYILQWKLENPFEYWIIHTYARMQIRVKGRKDVHNRGHWKGLPICSMEEFRGWADTQKNLWEQLQAVYSVTKRRGDAPSINRKDPPLGYAVTNLELKTVSQNSREARLGYRKVKV